jgi:hypothetical protein
LLVVVLWPSWLRLAEIDVFRVTKGQKATVLPLASYVPEIQSPARLGSR